MNKRLVKKAQDHGRKLNRVKLKREYTKLMDAYILEKRANTELSKDIERLEWAHQELLNDRDDMIAKTRDANNKLADALEDKINEVIGLKKENNELVDKCNLISKQHEQAKEVLEVMEKSLKTKEVHMRALGEQNMLLRGEMEKLNKPWYKRGFKK